MQSAGSCRPGGVIASPSHAVSFSAPTGQTKQLSKLGEEQLELTERDLWEDDEAGVGLCLSVSLAQLQLLVMVDTTAPCHQNCY